MRRRLAIAAVGGLLLGVSGSLHAQLVDVSPFAVASIAHDSNLLRTQRGVDGVSERRSDTLTRISLGLTAAFNPGLQAARLTAVYEPVQYRHFSRFNHEAYDLDARWTWRAGRRFDGQLGLTAERAIDDFANRSTPEAGFVRRQGVRALGGYNLSPRLRVELEGRHDRRDGSGAASPGFDLRESIAVAGIYYQGNRLSRLGGSVSVTDGRFPNRPAGTDLATDYEQTSVEGQLVWSPSALSDLDWTLGYTRRRQQPTATRDYSGLTGRLEYRRRISAKTRVSLRGYRRIYSAELQDANLTIDDGLRLGVDWAWSYKTQVGVALERREVEFEAGGAFAGAASQLDDDIQSASVTLDWQALERLGLLLAVEHASRTSSDSSRDYEALVGRFEVRLGF